MIKAWDLETIPNLELIPTLPEPEVALGNTKDPDKIKEKIAEAKRKQIDRLGLSPLTGRICSMSFYGETPESRLFYTIPEISDAAEIELINLVFAGLCVGKEETNKIITWNGHSFDFPYLYKRAAILRIPIPRDCPGLRYWTKRYDSTVHCDLMQELSGWEKSETISLDTAARMFLGKQKTKRDYATYCELIEKGEGEKIGIDNLCDTELTYELYQLLEPYLF
jgi:predicted PolB exonuclease-like 3'-5' exonuclease